MPEFLGVKFAPLFIPFERRLQTVAVAFWFLSLIAGFGCMFLTLLLVLFTKFYWLLLLYVAWIVYDRDIGNQGGRRSYWVRNWFIWKFYRDYFPAKLFKVEDAEFDPDRNYLFCCYPHGILSSGMFSSFGIDNKDYDKLFKKFVPYPVTLSTHFITPFFREYVLGLGACSASSESLTYLLSKEGGGNIVCLVVGGAEESFYCRPGDYKILLTRRRGFVRIALQTGSPLVPVFTFGETDIYNQVNNPQGSVLRWVQNNLKKLTGVAPIIPVGRGIFQYNYGLVPLRRPLNTVVGKPIDVPKISNPTNEQIEEYHQKFKEAISELFEKEKHKYIENSEKVRLEIL